MKQLEGYLGAEGVQSRIAECFECLSLGAQIVPEDNFSLALSLTAFRIMREAKSNNDWNLIETMLVQVIQRATNIIYQGYIIDFGRIEVPKWVEKQMEKLKQLVRFASARFTDSIAIQKASLNALFTISKKTLDLE